MLLSILGIGKELTIIGLLWYYFNVIAIAVIIYKLLDLATIRAKNARNIAESETKQDRMFIRFIMIISGLGIGYFFMREYIKEVAEFWEYLVSFVKGVIYG